MDTPENRTVNKGPDKGLDQAPDRVPDKVKLTIGSGGRINLPARQRRMLDLREGDEVVVGVENGGLRIESRDVAISRAQRKVRKRLREGRRLSEELIAERRAETEREDGATEGEAEGEAGAGRNEVG